MASKTFYSNTVAKHIRLRLTCTSKLVTGGSDVTATLDIEGYTFSGSALSGSNIKINGYKHSFTKVMPSGSSSSKRWYRLSSFTKYVPYSGSKTISVSGYWLWNGSYGGTSVKDLSVSGSFTLDTNAITPGKPGFSISNGGNTTTKWLEPESGAGRNYTVYSGRHSGSQPGNNGKTTMTFSASGGSSSSNVEIHLQWKRYGIGWTYARGYPKTTTSTTRTFYEGTPSASNNYNDGDRYREWHKGEYWCAWAVSVSSTGHKTRGDYHYFVYNDCPYPTSEASIQNHGNGIRLNLPSVAIGNANNGDRWYYIMYQVNGSGWKTPPTYKVANTSHVDYSWDELGVWEGANCNFCVAVGDQLEWNDHVWKYTSSLTRPVIPTTPSLSMSTSNGRARHVILDGINYAVHPGWDVNSVPGTAGVNMFYLRGSNDYGHGYKIALDRWTSSTGWYRYRDYYSSAVDIHFNVNEAYSSNNYNSSDRYPNSRFRLSVANQSSTGHVSTSGLTYFVINDAPTITAADFALSSDNKRATITWKYSDSLYSELYGYIIANVERNKYTTSKIIGSTQGSSKTITLSDYGIGSGDKISFSVRAGDNLEWNEKQAVLTRTQLINSRPIMSGEVTTSFDDVQLFGTGLTLRWHRAMDPDNDALKYKIKVISNGSFSRTIETRDDRYHYVAQESDETLSFEVIAEDGAKAQSDPIYSKVFKKASRPESVAPAIFDVEIGNEQIAEKIKGLSWGMFYDASKVQVINYEINVEKKNAGENNWTAIGEELFVKDTKCGDSWFYLLKEGDSLRYTVTGHDRFGLSNSISSKGIIKNTRPIMPAFFRCAETHNHVKDKIGMTWGNGSDEIPALMKYRITVSENRGTEKIIADNIIGNSFTHNIKNVYPGTRLDYFIKTIDHCGIMSHSKPLDKNGQISVNVPPYANTIVFPTAPIYAEEPRIFFRVTGDVDKNLMSAHVTIDNVTYSSNNSDHRKYFDKREYGNNEIGVFCLIDKEMPIGSKVIKIKMKDHLEFGKEISFTYTRKAPLLNRINDNEKRIITKNDYDNLTKMLNETISAYKVSGKVNKEDIIKHTHFADIRDRIINMQNKLNSLAKGFTRITNATIIKNGLITKEMLNTLLNGIFKP